MPRNSTSSSGKSKNNAWPNVLRFVASLLFLYVLFGGSNASGSWWSTWVTSTPGSVWLPLLFGAAVLSTIGLFFGSLAGLVWNKSNGHWGMKLSLVAAFTLVVMTGSFAWTSVFWVVILGFFLGWIASAMDMM